MDAAGQVYFNRDAECLCEESKNYTLAITDFLNANVSCFIKS